MPSWGVHTALANDLIYRIESKKNISDLEKSCFLRMKLFCLMY